MDYLHEWELQLESLEVRTMKKESLNPPRQQRGTLKS